MDKIYSLLSYMVVIGKLEFGQNKEIWDFWEGEMEWENMCAFFPNSGQPMAITDDKDTTWSYMILAGKNVLLILRKLLNLPEHDNFQTFAVL